MTNTFGVQIQTIFVNDCHSNRNAVKRKNFMFGAGQTVWQDPSLTKALICGKHFKFLACQIEFELLQIISTFIIIAIQNHQNPCNRSVGHGILISSAFSQIQ